MSAKSPPVDLDRPIVVPLPHPLAARAGRVGSDCGGVLPGRRRLAGGPRALGLAAIGFVGWTLLEYDLHRFVFHYRVKRAFGR